MTELTAQYLEVKNKSISLQKKIKSLETKQEKLYTELEELHKLCTHEELEEKESYYGGSYDERASTNYWNQCTLCGAKSKTVTVTHSYYG